MLAPLFDHLPDPIYVVDPDSARILYCNRAGREHFGMSREELLQRTVVQLHADLADHGHWQRVAGAIRQQGDYIYLARHRHQAGHHMSVEVHNRHFVHGGREYFVSVARRMVSESGPAGAPQAILDRDARVRFALNDAIDGLWEWDIAGRDLYFSPQWLRMLGYKQGQPGPSALDWLRAVHPDDLRRVKLALREHLRGRRERFEAEYRVRNRNGHYLWVQDRGTVSDRDPRGRALRMVGMTHDITERKLLELELQRRATHDGLTGLLNRRESEIVLATQVQLCGRLGCPLAVCLFDIDHFKEINDRLGHLTGDVVLQRVAELISGAVRAADYLFRWGGEEFLLVCADTDQNSMSQLAEKLRLLLERAQWPAIDGLQRVTASFGVASFPHYLSVRELLLAADTALYRAKHNGRNRVEPPPSPRGVAQRDG